MSTKSSIKERLYQIVLRNQVRGVTTKTAALKLEKDLNRAGIQSPPYSSVRARLYELASEGAIFRDDSRGVARFS